MNDIFTAKFLFPQTVCILAPGPLGKPHWDRCRDYTIAVNRAVLIPLYQPHAWVVADKTALEKDWWDDADSDYVGQRIFSEKIYNILLERLIVGFGHYHYIESSLFTFDYERLGKHDTPIPKTEYLPMPGRFQGDGTTSGIAIEMAARFGAKKIYLCGVDFRGDTHWDGMRSPCTISDRQGDWSEFLPYMNSLIEWVQAQGIEIYSYSPTAIKVGVI